MKNIYTNKYLITRNLGLHFTSMWQGANSKQTRKNERIRRTYLEKGLDREPDKTGDCSNSYSELAPHSVNSKLPGRKRSPLIKRSIAASFMLLFTVLIVPPAHSQTANTLSLEEAIGVAAVHNLSIQQAGNNVQVSKNNANLGNAGLMPRLDLNTGSTITDATVQTAGGEISTQSTRNTVGINAGYTLFRGMQGLNTYKLLNTQAEASALQLGLITENTLYATSQAYFNLLMTYDNLVILKEQISVSRERLGQALDKNDLGMSSRLQALAARVDFDSDSSSVLEAEYAFSEARRRLNLLLGWELDRRYTPVAVNRKFGSYTSVELVQQVLNKNKTLLLSQNQEIQGQLNLKNSRSSRFPALNLSGSYGLQKINADVDPDLGEADKTFSTGLSLSWNIFDGRKGKNIQNARIQQKNSELNTLDSKRQALSDLESTHSSFIKSLQILELKQNNLVSAQLNFDQTNEYFRLGVVSSTQFRESQLNLSRVKISLIQAKYSAYLDELKIWQLTGQLEEKMLTAN
ncbi:MAG: TolC family protein [Candidatus Marinimicrobia bacterium]|nr:TolC family protein [Candidatus Neomarinimicrobiota bacterium]